MLEVPTREPLVPHARGTISHTGGAPSLARRGRGRHPGSSSVGPPRQAAAQRGDVQAEVRPMQGVCRCRDRRVSVLTALGSRGINRAQATSPDSRHQLALLAGRAILGRTAHHPKRTLALGSPVALDRNLPMKTMVDIPDAKRSDAVHSNQNGTGSGRARGNGLQPTAKDPRVGRLCRDMSGSPHRGRTPRPTPEVGSRSLVLVDSSSWIHLLRLTRTLCGVRRPMRVTELGVGRCAELRVPLDRKRVKVLAEG